MTNEVHRSTFPMVSTSLGQDMAYLALADVVHIATNLALDCRIVGGNAVALLIAAYQVEGVPPRETADADVAADTEVLANDDLYEQLRLSDYKHEDGSRLSRGLRPDEEAMYGTEAFLRPTIDLLTPSTSGRSEANRPAGKFSVDAFPGLSLALARPAIHVHLEVTLTTGADLSISVPLPEPQALLCVKLLAYQSRLEERDAVDVWRLLATCRAAGISPADWRRSGVVGDGLRALHTFVRPGSHGLRNAAKDARTQAEIRALAAAVAPAPDASE